MEVYDRVTTFEGVAALLIVIGVKVRLLELESAEPEAGHLKKHRRLQYVRILP